MRPVRDQEEGISNQGQSNWAFAGALGNGNVMWWKKYKTGYLYNHYVIFTLNIEIETQPCLEMPSLKPLL